jgi:hypothetical protein
MMLSILEFIFSSFWHWLGTLLLVAVAGTSIGSVFAALRGK